MMRSPSLGLLALAVAGCGSATSAPEAGAPGDADAAEAPPLVCVDASPGDVATYETPAGKPFCGGEVAMAGLTPFGWWAPQAVRSFFELGGCYGLSLIFDDDPTHAGEPGSPALSVFLKEAKSGEAWSGTFHVSGALRWGAGESLTIPVTVEISAAERLFAPEAHEPSDGVGPRGLVTGRIDADTGCGHVTGTFSVPYCAWAACILN